MILAFQSTHPRGVRPAASVTASGKNTISIHAPARGATRAMPREGGRLGISIHAPARGATAAAGNGKAIYRHFNPRTREGCDADVNVMCDWVITFQSTHPRGVRPPEDVSHETEGEFQSTHPRGVRPHALAAIGAHDKISIHAPARGATRKCFRALRLHDQFQSTHPRGVRPRAVCFADGVEGISIHAPARGATR